MWFDNYYIGRMKYLLTIRDDGSMYNHQRVYIYLDDNNSIAFCDRVGSIEDFNEYNKPDEIYRLWRKYGNQIEVMYEDYNKGCTLK